MLTMLPSLARTKDRPSSSGLLDHIRGDEMRKEEATNARRQQNNRTKNPITLVVTLPPSSLSPRPRVLTPREGVHPLSRSVVTLAPFSPVLSREDTACPLTRLFSAFPSPPDALSDASVESTTLVTAIWTLVRQLISALMFLVARTPRPRRAHHREEIARHTARREPTSDQQCDQTDGLID